MLRTLFGHLFRLVHTFMFRIRHGGRDEWSVSFSDGVISLSKNELPHEMVRLSQVKRIRAVSRDMATRDEIFLVFETDGKGYWVGEYFRGFDAFAEQLQSVIQLRIAEWYAELGKAEPFTNPEVLLWEE